MSDKGTNIVLIGNSLIPYTFCESKPENSDTLPTLPKTSYHDYRLLAVSNDYTDMSYHDELTHEGRVFLCKYKQDKTYDRLLALATGQAHDCLMSVFQARARDIYTSPEQVYHDVWQARYIATADIDESPVRGTALTLPIHPH